MGFYYLIFFLLSFYFNPYWPFTPFWCENHCLNQFHLSTRRIQFPRKSQRQPWRWPSNMINDMLGIAGQANVFSRQRDKIRSPRVQPTVAIQINPHFIHFHPTKPGRSSSSRHRLLWFPHARPEKSNKNSNLVSFPVTALSDGSKKKS